MCQANTEYVSSGFVCRIERYGDHILHVLQCFPSLLKIQRLGFFLSAVVLSDFCPFTTCGIEIMALAFIWSF